MDRHIVIYHFSLLSFLQRKAAGSCFEYYFGIYHGYFHRLLFLCPDRDSFFCKHAYGSKFS